MDGFVKCCFLFIVKCIAMELHGSRYSVELLMELGSVFLELFTATANQKTKSDT